MSQWAGIVLAAGMGTRMNSTLPKVLHPVCGKEMIRYPVDLLRQLGAGRIVVVVSPGNSAAVRGLLADQVEYATQPSALGTGDAIAQAKELLRDSADHLVVLGADCPLVQADTVKQLMASHLESSSVMSILVGNVASVGDFGCILRDDSGQVAAIVEAPERKSDGSAPGEINSGVYCFSAPWLWDSVERIEPNPNGERYITSLAAIGASGSAQGASIVNAMAATDPGEVQGVNNRIQLAQVEAVIRQRIRDRWMLDGVTMVDPASVFIDADVSIGRDTVIMPNTMLLGNTQVGEESVIGPGSVVRDSIVGSRCRVNTSMLEESTMEDGSDIGPFSHLRPGVYLESGVHLGNFVEVKESRIGSGTHIGHLGYVGDASIGSNVNLGAGTVTCNYDGKSKYRTVIESGAFIGCDTMLVAPVTVGADAVTGAGAVVTNDVPAGRLAVGVPARIIDRKSNPI